MAEFSIGSKGGASYEVGDIRWTMAANVLPDYVPLDGRLIAGAANPEFSAVASGNSTPGNLVEYLQADALSGGWINQTDSSMQRTSSSGRYVLGLRYHMVWEGGYDNTGIGGTFNIVTRQGEYVEDRTYQASSSYRPINGMIRVRFHPRYVVTMRAQNMSNTSSTVDIEFWDLRTGEMVGSLSEFVGSLSTNRYINFLDFHHDTGWAYFAAMGYTHNISGGVMSLFRFNVDTLEVELIDNYAPSAVAAIFYIAWPSQPVNNAQYLIRGVINPPGSDKFYFVGGNNTAIYTYSGGTWAYSAGISPTSLVEFPYQASPAIYDETTGKIFYVYSDDSQLDHPYYFAEIDTAADSVNNVSRSASNLTLWRYSRGPGPWNHTKSSDGRWTIIPAYESHELLLHDKDTDGGIYDWLWAGSASQSTEQSLRRCSTLAIAADLDQPDGFNYTANGIQPNQFNEHFSVLLMQRENIRIITDMRIVGTETEIDILTLPGSGGGAIGSPVTVTVPMEVHSHLNTYTRYFVDQGGNLSFSNLGNPAGRMKFFSSADGQRLALILPGTDNFLYALSSVDGGTTWTAPVLVCDLNVSSSNFLMSVDPSDGIICCVEDMNNVTRASGFSWYFDKIQIREVILDGASVHLPTIEGAMIKVR